MRRIINYIRQCFCSHDWLIEDRYIEIFDEFDNWQKKGTKVYMRCKKCGYHQKHWKA